MILKLLILLLSPSFAKVSFEDFLHLKVALNAAFTELRPNQNHLLSINQPVGKFENYWWNIDTAHASYSLLEDEGLFHHNIFLFGGFARLKEMTLDGLAVTACHEIGHGIGGAPFKNNGKSQEGQADYYSTNTCLPIVFKYLTETKTDNYNPFILNFCMEAQDIAFCERAMHALESDISFFEYLGETTRFETRSLNITHSLDFSNSYYPSAQCRLDTMVNGIINEERPTCWFPNL